MPYLCWHLNVPSVNIYHKTATLMRLIWLWFLNLDHDQLIRFQRACSTWMNQIRLPFHLFYPPVSPFSVFGGNANKRGCCWEMTTLSCEDSSGWRSILEVMLKTPARLAQACHQQYIMLMKWQKPNAICQKRSASALGLSENEEAGLKDRRRQRDFVSPEQVPCFCFCM